MYRVEGGAIYRTEVCTEVCTGVIYPNKVVSDPGYDKQWQKTKKLHEPLAEAKPTGMKAKDWALLDRQALGAIRLSLAKNVAYNVVNEKTAYDLFKALSNMYEKPSRFWKYDSENVAKYDFEVFVEKWLNGEKCLKLSCWRQLLEVSSRSLIFTVFPLGENDTQTVLKCDFLNCAKCGFVLGQLCAYDCYVNIMWFDLYLHASRCTAMYVISKDLLCLSELIGLACIAMHGKGDWQGFAMSCVVLS
ncbi:hypothetical protein Tco_0590043 [Tanacetum coccineum]